MNKNLLAICLFCGLIIIGILSAFKKKDYSNWKVTVARVYKIWEFDGSEITYEYWVNGMRYQNGGSSPSGTIYGDLFLILYNPKNPTDCIMNTSTPYFLENDNVDFADGEIIGEHRISADKYKDKSYYYFRFKYYVNGKKYEKDQDITFCGEPVFKLENGMKIKVKYDVNIPQRSVLIFEGLNMYIVRDIPCEFQDKLVLPTLR